MRITIGAILWAVLFCLQLNVNAKDESTTQGIRFENRLRWEQLLAKAKTENKYIMVDCYTTWCAPCKKMELNVYPLKEVGDFFNAKFISTKFQMDSTGKDNDIVRSRYADARKIMDDYKITGFPSYLIFTPNGKLLGRFEGMHEADVFVKKAADVINPEFNYYSFLDDYKKGKKDYSRMAWMARAALKLQDSANAYILAADYIRSPKQNDWFTKGNIYFLAEFTKTTKDPGFKIVWQNSNAVNRTMEEDDYSKKFIQRIIYLEYLTKALIRASETGTNPDWNSLYTSIKKHFGDYYAERVILSAKPSWYHTKNDMKNYVKYLVLYFEKYQLPTMTFVRNENGSSEDFDLNNYAWEVFKYSSDQKELETALEWSNNAVRINPQANWMDTYANLLYKLGKTKLAIKWETVASQVDPNDNGIKSNLEKMKEGVGTWQE